MGTYQTRNPKAVNSPLRSLPLYKPAAQVLGWTALDKATFILRRARTEAARAEAYLPIANASLGKANRVRGVMRRTYQAQAFHRINQARAELRAARKALAAAEAAMLALDGDLFGGAV